MPLLVPTQSPSRTSPAIDAVELLRIDATRQSLPDHKSRLGQFLTPASVARLMAGMLRAPGQTFRLLDPGAGVGSLFSACVSELVSRRDGPRRIEVDAYEIDQGLFPYMRQAVGACQRECRQAGVELEARLHAEDFLAVAAETSTRSLFSTGAAPAYDGVIVNPPYYKLNVGSAAYRTCDDWGVPVTNMYAAFLLAAIRLLAPAGELVAITPRSFCNGTYFRRFREHYLSQMSLRRLHVFESRLATFADDGVLQENVISHAVRSSQPPTTVEVSTSQGPDSDHPRRQAVDWERIVIPGDPESYLRIPSATAQSPLLARGAELTCTLADLGLAASTGRVVAFRARAALRQLPEAGTVPLIHPFHFAGPAIAWPREHAKKPNHILADPSVSDQLLPANVYVLVKRFSAKEEPRRVVAAVFDPARVPCRVVGFENHLNYIHAHGAGLDPDLAWGLVAFLNSQMLDTSFREFSGHTQVNATDLRQLRFPTIPALRTLGHAAGERELSPEELDQLVARHVFTSAGPEAAIDSPSDSMKRIEEALEVLRSLELPAGQLNERSALTLLALLDLKPRTPWGRAQNPLRGVTPLMDFFAEHYGKSYAPNSRETVRQQTLHQFLEAGLIVANPDEPERPTNSGKTVYQIESAALELLRNFGGPSWGRRLRRYLSQRESLKSRFAAEREMARIPVQVDSRITLRLSPGGQNLLVKEIIEQFAPRFTPGGQLVYIGDTENKIAHLDAEKLAELGIVLRTHGKMPDVIVYYAAKNWLVLIEAVTSHGPVDPKRHAELKRLFAGSKAGLVFVTAFADRRGLVAYLDKISWETEVWVAESPSHLIHFDGERFLGPYPADADSAGDTP